MNQIERHTFAIQACQLIEARKPNPNRERKALYLKLRKAIAAKGFDQKFATPHQFVESLFEKREG